MNSLPENTSYDNVPDWWNEEYRSNLKNSDEFRKRCRNLNKIPVRGVHNRPTATVDNQATSACGSVTAYFRNLEHNLISHIACADIVVGCVAWLTNSNILKAMAAVSGVSIIVQKEDFLRPDAGSRQNWKTWLRSQYGSLKMPVPRQYMGCLAKSLSLLYDERSNNTIDPVRCVGNYNRELSPAFPRMHNKFLVFCKLLEDTLTPEDDGYEPFPRLAQPYSVWTGSFNFTGNAADSLENALYITDKNICEAYYSEWGQILAVSEPLDWTADWCRPEWKIGS